VEITTRSREGFVTLPKARLHTLREIANLFSACGNGWGFNNMDCCLKLPEFYANFNGLNYPCFSIPHRNENTPEKLDNKE
jgi:hypothetical protein